MANKANNDEVVTWRNGKKLNEENPKAAPKKSFWEKESSVTAAVSADVANNAGGDIAEAGRSGGEVELDNESRELICLLPKSPAEGCGIF